MPALNFSQRGSSPRSRGTFKISPHPGEKGRFIPALAGNMAGITGGMCGAPVHPRARGEHVRAVMPPQPTPGSSPRSRGTWRRGRPPPAGGRFIPALAGNMPIGRSPRSTATVHPRARGEHAPRRPRRRGNQRFIPALAGNIFAYVFPMPVSAVHPRARGEHKKGSTTIGRKFGSSPRSRGT